MEDTDIILLYLARDEKALYETQKKYGAYCYSIAYNILNNPEDSEECVNDTYFNAWKSIPPNKPKILSAFLGKITRNLSLRKFRNKNASKRGGGLLILALEELEECIPSSKSVYEEIQTAELAEIIDTFLRTIPDEDRRIFIRRYWHFNSISEICQLFGYSESKIKMKLHRTRQKLLTQLEKEDIAL